MATIHFSPFTCCFRRFLWPSFTGCFSATTTPNSQNHFYVHYSLSKFRGEWFTNHSNHIHIFTPITRAVATKCHTMQKGPKMGIFRHFRGFQRTPQKDPFEIFFAISGPGYLSPRANGPLITPITFTYSLESPE